MRFSLSVAALFAIYGQTLSQGLGQVSILLERATSGSAEILTIDEGIPVFQTPSSDNYHSWQISQVGSTAYGNRIVNIQNTATGGYLSCSTAEEGAPCGLKQSKYSIQAFIESLDSEENGLYEFRDQRTEEILYATNDNHLALAETPTDDEPTTFWLQEQH